MRRLGAGDIAVIDHADLDRMAAEDLVESGVRAVVNVAPSTSTRYPNPGPLILVRAGVHLVDAVGAPLFDELADGDPVTISGRRRVGAARRRSRRARVRTLDELTRVAREQQDADRRGDRARSPRTRWSASATSASCSPGACRSPTCARSSATGTC